MWLLIIQPQNKTEWRQKMSDGDASLSQALSQLSEVAEALSEDEIEEVARVRKDRANITEHARQSGDNAGSLLSSLIGQSNAELEAEKQELERIARKKEAEEKAKQEADAEKARREAQTRLEEEKKKLEEKEQRRLQMLADLEKKRKHEAGIVDEEEEAAKRAAEEEKAKREAAQKAREEAEAAALNSDNAELADRIQALKNEKLAREAAIAREEQKRKMMFRSLVAIVAAVIIVFVVAFIATRKAQDPYTLNPSYATKALKLETLPTVAFASTELAYAEVVQEAPKVIQKSRGEKPKTDKYGIGSAKNVLSGTSIIK